MPVSIEVRVIISIKSMEFCLLPQLFVTRIKATPELRQVFSRLPILSSGSQTICSIVSLSIDFGNGLRDTPFSASMVVSAMTRDFLTDNGLKQYMTFPMMFRFIFQCMSAVYKKILPFLPIFERYSNFYKHTKKFLMKSDAIQFIVNNLLLIIITSR